MSSYFKEAVVEGAKICSFSDGTKGYICSLIILRDVYVHSLKFDSTKGQVYVLDQNI